MLRRRWRFRGGRGGEVPQAPSARPGPDDPRSLDRLRPGEAGLIVGLIGEEADRLRLMEMGLLEGETIQVLKFAPLGDPIEILLRGYHLSLRKESARQVLVAPEGADRT